MVEISLLGSEGARAGNRPGYLTLIRLAGADFLTLARGPWGPDFMAVCHSSCPENLCGWNLSGARARALPDLSALSTLLP